jgi:NAD+ kinase
MIFLCATLIFRNMKKIALFGMNFSEDFNKNILALFDIFNRHKAELYIHEKFAAFLLQNTGIKTDKFKTFIDTLTLPPDTDFLFSFGGDGTFLETLKIVKDRDIPIIGINTGRLGFLANISRDEICISVEDLFQGNYSLEERTLIRLSSNKSVPGEFNVALNEITIHKYGAGMISVITELDGEYLNTYWADGLIISTPTGSTAYSMSVGGPIVLPESRNYIISPIAPHNLSVRPLIVPDNKTIGLKVKSREDRFLVSVDSITREVENDIVLNIDKAPYSLKLVKFPGTSFYNTLRNKLMWGVDKRN